MQSMQKNMDTMTRIEEDEMTNDEKEVLADTFGFSKDQLYNKYGRFYDKNDSILYRHGNIYHLVLKNGKVRNVKLIEQ